jgi:DNA-binding GntR family transcriptional regulator
MSDMPEALRAVLRSFSIERSSPIPLYFQVSHHLEQAIESGALPPGTLFVNEIELAERLGVSRPTMRRAMESLVDQGLIVRRRGVGTRVVQPKVRRPLELTSLFDDLTQSGQAPTTQILELGPVPAPPDVAAHLGVPPETEVVRIVRVRSAREQPIAVMTNYLPADLVMFDSADLEATGLYALLRRQGIRLHTATQRVGAKVATAAEGKLLGEQRGTALLTMQRETLDDMGRVVEYGTHLYAASRYSFETHLVEP